MLAPMRCCPSSPKGWKGDEARLEGVRRQGQLERWIAFLLVEGARGLCLFLGIGLDRVRNPWRGRGCEGVVIEET